MLPAPQSLLFWQSILFGFFNDLYRFDLLPANEIIEEFIEHILSGTNPQPVTQDLVRAQKCLESQKKLTSTIQM